MWGDQNESSVNRYYDIRSIDSDSKELVLFNASLAGEIKRQTVNMSEKINSRLRFESFNFSKTSLTDYDVLVFRGKKSLPAMDRQYSRLLGYNEKGKIMVVSELNHTDLKKNHFLNKTGLNWVNLSVQNNSASYLQYTDSDNAERAERYFNIIGCSDCGGFSMPMRDKVSSGGTRYIPEETIFPDSGITYDTSKWYTRNYSMDPDSTGPIGINSGCNNPHSEGTFKFASGTGFETLTVYNTKLGKTVSDCDGAKAVTIDRNGDGDVTDSREGPFTSGSNVIINRRKYEVNIKSHTEVDFTYKGSDSYEFVNYRNTFPDRKIRKFVRVGSLRESGVLGGDDNEQVVLVTSLLYWMVESDRKFGPKSKNQISTSLSGGLDDSNQMPYKVHLRWSR
jgi:hypothetical protein